MFPKASTSSSVLYSIPRVSGGVSRSARTFPDKTDYSPRQRGCFFSMPYAELRAMLFPASAGVFPASSRLVCGTATIPRVSGGVSVNFKCAWEEKHYSPRQRGCFHHSLASRLYRRLFPASAGVFPRSLRSGTPSLTIPRVSGGVSGDLPHEKQTPRYSPRQRGCFQRWPDIEPEPLLFPASAGVFPPVEIVEKSPLPIPRVSGGVSLFRSSSGMASCYSPRQRGCFHRG